MAPPPERFISGTASRAVSTAPLRLIASTSSHTSRSMSTSERSRPNSRMPAAFTKIVEPAGILEAFGHRLRVTAASERRSACT